MSSQIVTVGAAVFGSALSVASAVYVARATRKSSRDLEILKSKLAGESADAQNRREYEYAARKRLYAECEPLIMKMVESCDTAASRILDLADGRRWSELSASRDIDSFWMLTKSSEVISFARAFLEPLALYTLLSEKVTLVDLTFDARVSEIYTLARAAYGVHLDDYKISEMTPALPYDPVVPGWRQKRAKEPAKYWWQGLTRGRLDPAIEVCVNRDEGRLTTVAEFEERYLELFRSPGESKNKSLGLFCNPLYNFTPEDRPVYWRMLMCQLLIYRRISLRGRLAPHLATHQNFDFDGRDVDSLQRSNSITDKLLDSSFDVALRYTNRIWSDAARDAATG